MARRKVGAARDSRHDHRKGGRPTTEKSVVLAIKCQRRTVPNSHKGITHMRKVNAAILWLAATARHGDWNEWKFSLMFLHIFLSTDAV